MSPLLSKSNTWIESGHIIVNCAINTFIKMICISKNTFLTTHPTVIIIYCILNVLSNFPSITRKKFLYFPFRWQVSTKLMLMTKLKQRNQFGKSVREKRKTKEKKLITMILALKMMIMILEKKKIIMTMMKVMN